MSQSPELRAGDSDRDHTIAQLREAYAEGRLNSQEFDARLDRAHAARTFGELAELTRDLPVPTSLAPSVAGGDPPSARRRGMRDVWAAWLGVGVIVNIVWLGTWMGNGSAPYDWPIWVMGPWGGALIIATLARNRNDE